MNWRKRSGHHILSLNLRRTEPFCFCVDYHKLNAVTIRNSHPIPRMDHCNDSLGEVTIFTTLDANTKYWKIEIAGEDRDKAAFTFHHGVFCFTCMPLGLKNAIPTFERLMDVLWMKGKWNIALVHSKYIIIFSATTKNEIDHDRQLLAILRQGVMKTKLKICKFYTDRIKFLRYVIGAGALKCQQMRLTQYVHSNTRINWENFNHFSAVQRLSSLCSEFCPCFHIVE